MQLRPFLLHLADALCRRSNVRVPGAVPVVPACNTSRSCSCPQSFAEYPRRRPSPPRAGGRRWIPAARTVGVALRFARAGRVKCIWISDKGEKSARSRQAPTSSNEKPSCRSERICCKRATSTAAYKRCPASVCHEGFNKEISSYQCSVRTDRPVRRANSPIFQGGGCMICPPSTAHGTA